VAQGLKVMAKRENTGLAALIDASRLNRAPTCSDLGFALGPRINAAGRIGDSSLGVRLLTTNDAEEARDIATRLSMLNDERRAIEQAVQEAAEMQVDGQHNRAVNVLAGEGWHPGVIGIVAGRIKEKTGKPTLVIALDADEAGNGKGSGRSIAGVDLGGRSSPRARTGCWWRAAGTPWPAASPSIPPPSRLADWLDERLARDVASARATQSLLLDLSLNPGGLTPDLVTTLEAGGPYGWPGPRIAVGPVRLVKCDLVGTDHVRMVASGADGRSFKAIAFRAAASELGQTLLHGTRGRQLWLRRTPGSMTGAAAPPPNCTSRTRHSPTEENDEIGA
jgi:single-stranded-DNA-specific exonuclease